MSFFRNFPLFRLTKKKKIIESKTEYTPKPRPTKYQKNHPTLKLITERNYDMVVKDCLKDFYGEDYIELKKFLKHFNRTSEYELLIPSRFLQGKKYRQSIEDYSAEHKIKGLRKVGKTMYLHIQLKELLFYWLSTKRYFIYLYNHEDGVRFIKKIRANKNFAKEIRKSTPLLIETKKIMIINITTESNSAKVENLYSQLHTSATGWYLSSSCDRVYKKMLKYAQKAI